jgi:hypothetical protein
VEREEETLLTNSFLQALAGITILTDYVVSMLLPKAKTIIQKFLKFQTE